MIRNKETVMDQNEKMDLTVPPVKAEKKHIVMFVIACVLLAGILLFLSLPTGMEVPDASDEPADPLVLVGAFMYMIGQYLIAAFLVFVGVLTAWIVGLVLAVKLARRRAVLPKGLWVASVVLTGLYLLLLAVLVAACFW